MTQVIVKPLGGLCNRLRVIDSAIALAESSGRSVHVVWEANPDCNASFESLFAPPHRFEVIETVQDNKRRHARFSNRGFERIEDPVERDQHRELSLERDIPYRVYNRDLMHYWRNEMSYSFDAIPPDQGIYISTEIRFVSNDEHGRHFEPESRLGDTVAQYVSDFTSSTIGVHIRRGDHQKAIAVSPVECFIDAMRARVAIDADTNFFVATDDDEVEQEMSRAFPGRVMTHTKSGGRNDSEGMKDAVIDLFCLAATSGIIGTPKSSYSVYAAKLGGLALVRAEAPA